MPRHAPVALDEARSAALLQTVRERLEPQVSRTNTIPEKLGSWRIEGPLGRGGMGTVYRGVHERTGKAAAIKTAPSDSPLGAALRLESSSLAGFNHRGIVHVFDQGEDDGLTWMAIQLVEGRTLQAVIRERAERDPPIEGPPTPAEQRQFLTWLRDFALALHCLHERGMVHRDIKPANLMIATDGSPFLIDFGLSLDVTRDPVIDALAGTVPYMSPEQVLAVAQIDGRSDIYSLAATFFELLTGQRLVRTHEMRATVFAEVANSPNPKLSAVAPGLPTAFDAVFEKALNKPVGHRYRTAHHFAEDIDRLLARRAPIHAPEATRARLARHWRTIAAALAVVLICTLLVVPTWQRREQLAALRADVVAGLASTEAALNALDEVLRLQPSRGTDAEFRDVFARAVSDLAPALTLEVFRRAAFAPSNRADATFAGQAGARATRLLALDLDLAPATRDELTVQAVFADLRAARFREARAAVTPTAAERDDRIRLLGVIAADADDGIADVGAVLRSVGTDHANLNVTQICCRAYLFLESRSLPGGADESMMRGLAAALEEHLTKARRANGPRNFVAGLLALVRLSIDEPQAALLTLESALGDAVTGPDPGERPAMALMAAVAMFRSLLRDPDNERPRMQRLVEYLREAITAAPQLMARMRDEIDDPAVGPTQRVPATLAAMFEELLQQGVPPRTIRGPALWMMQFAALAWYERNDARALLAYAEHLEAEGLREPADELSFDANHRAFWLMAIDAAAREWPGGARRLPQDLDRSHRFYATARHLVRPPHVEFDAVLALQAHKASPEDPALLAALAEHHEPLQQRLAAIKASATKYPGLAELIGGVLGEVPSPKR